MLNIILISGNTQRDGRWNGLKELQEILREKLNNYNMRSVRITVRRHNERWDWIADDLQLLRRRYKGEPFHVLVFCYSWGVGEGLVKLTKHLKQYGIKIQVAVICDGIYKHWWSRFLAQWRALRGTGYRLAWTPGVIESYHGFYQENDEYVQGLRPVVGTEKHPAKELSWMQLDLPHNEMHFAPEFHDKCVEVALQWASYTNKPPEPAPQTPEAESKLAIDTAADTRIASRQ